MDLQSAAYYWNQDVGGRPSSSAAAAAQGCAGTIPRNAPGNLHRRLGAEAGDSILVSPPLGKFLAQARSGPPDHAHLYPNPQRQAVYLPSNGLGGGGMRPSVSTRICLHVGGSRRAGGYLDATRGARESKNDP